MKQVRVNVNLFFNVPDTYKVTDCETVEHLRSVTLHDAFGDEIAEGVVSHESIETVDMSDTEDYTEQDEEDYYADRALSREN